jgi:hypothetical protein
MPKKGVADIEEERVRRVGGERDEKPDMIEMSGKVG